MSTVWSLITTWKESGLKCGQCEAVCCTVIMLMFHSPPGVKLLINVWLVLYWTIWSSSFFEYVQVVHFSYHQRLCNLREFSNSYETAHRTEKNSAICRRQCKTELNKKTVGIICCYMMSDASQNWKSEYFGILRKEQHCCYNRFGQRHEFERGQWFIFRKYKKYRLR